MQVLSSERQVEGCSTDVGLAQVCLINQPGWLPDRASDERCSGNIGLASIEECVAQQWRYTNGFGLFITLGGLVASSSNSASL